MLRVEWRLSHIKFWYNGTHECWFGCIYGCVCGFQTSSSLWVKPTCHWFPQSDQAHKVLEAPEAALHRGAPEGVSHVPRRGVSSQGHGVLRVVVQIVVVGETATAGRSCCSRWSRKRDRVRSPHALLVTAGISWMTIRPSRKKENENRGSVSGPQILPAHLANTAFLLKLCRASEKAWNTLLALWPEHSRVQGWSNLGSELTAPVIIFTENAKNISGRGHFNYIKPDHI